MGMDPHEPSFPHVTVLDPFLKKPVSQLNLAIAPNVVVGAVTEPSVRLGIPQSISSESRAIYRHILLGSRAALLRF